MTRRPMSARQARATIESATLVKAPTWREDRDWHVIDSSRTVLVVVTPQYRAGRRSGWTWRLVGHGPSRRHERHANRELAAVAGLAAWERWVTRPRA